VHLAAQFALGPLQLRALGRFHCSGRSLVGSDQLQPSTPAEALALAALQPRSRCCRPVRPAQRPSFRIGLEAACHWPRRASCMAAGRGTPAAGSVVVGRRKPCLLMFSREKTRLIRAIRAGRLQVVKTSMEAGVNRERKGLPAGIPAS